MPSSTKASHMIINDQISHRRNSKRCKWSSDARQTVIAAAALPGATASTVALKYNGLLDGGRGLSPIQVRTILRSKNSLPARNPKHIWTDHATNLIIHHVRDLEMNSQQVAALWTGKLDGGQKLTPSAVRGLVARHDRLSAQVAKPKAAQETPALPELAKTLAKPSKPSLLRLVSNTAPPAQILPSRPFIPAAKPAENPLSALFLDNLTDRQCRYIKETTAEGMSVCCGQPTAPRQRLRGGTGQYYSWCDEHAGKMMQMPASAKTIDQFVNRTQRQIERYA